MIFVGDDWAEDHHDIYLMAADGARLASRRLPEGLAGIAGLHEVIASHANEPGDVVIGIETDRGLWVQALGAAGYQVFAINPLAVARYRDRHQVSGAKSDAGDAKVLADLVCTDRHNHRALAGGSAEAEAIKVLARAHQNLIWARTRHTNALRSALREYYPAALGAFENLHDRDSMAVLGRAPTPGTRCALEPGQDSIRPQKCGASTQYRHSRPRDRSGAAHRIPRCSRTVECRVRRDHPRCDTHHRRTQPPDQRA